MIRLGRIVVLALAVAGAMALAQPAIAEPALSAPSLFAAFADPLPAAAPPETTVTGGGDRWYRQDVVLAFRAQSASASIASIHLRANGEDVIDVPGDRYDLTLAAPADHSRDGRHVVEYRAVDDAGTPEAWKSVTVNIDTRKPVTRPLHAVGVMRTATAKVGLRVNDEDPQGGKATVKIVISTWGGRDVKTVTRTGQDTNTDLTVAFRCDLPAGFYRVRIEARDGAGNWAATVGKTRLIVTRWMRVQKFGAVVVPPNRLAYVSGTPIPRIDTAARDRHGVRMYLSNGKLRDYPGGQARYGLSNLNTYRLTGDEFYLRRAAAQAQRLLDTRIQKGKAWYYPQRYTRYRHSKHNNGELMKEPWYSGMAQGQVVSFMVSMYETTGDKKYLLAARSTMYSFLFIGPASRPWTMTVDGSQRLWVQEWPRLPLDHTYNGHMISSFGLYDYWRVTNDSLALLLFRATASTALDQAPNFRRPGRASSYCLLHRTPNEKYHGIHITCFRHLYNFTGEPGFAQAADIYTRDYPGVMALPPAGGDGEMQSLMSESLGDEP